MRLNLLVHNIILDYLVLFVTFIVRDCMYYLRRDKEKVSTRWLVLSCTDDRAAIVFWNCLICAIYTHTFCTIDVRVLVIDLRE